MNYDVLEGKEEVFENAFSNVVEAMAGVAGHTESFLYRNVGKDSRYLIVSKWENREAFDAFISSETFHRVTNWGKEQILAGRPQHEIYG
jgi:heme-degrading monooxygenase HmoA